jgi:enoyl-CoA hydratase/carnithine racemase
MSGDGRNPLDLTLISELAQALEELDGDLSFRCAVVASDDRHFCAGAVSKIAETVPTWSTRDLYALIPRLFAVDIPIVVALNGAAIGGGLGLALIGEWRQVAENARLQANFPLLGYSPGFGTTLLLARIVGEHRASELLISGRSVDAREAFRIGLADGLSPPENLREEAIARARVIGAGAPLAGRAVKATRLASVRQMLPKVLAAELELQERLKATADYKEGIDAARQGRAPRFAGR